jgi:hypothetical protein
MPTGDLVTQKEAAAILNRSVSAVSRAIRDGRLTYADSANRLLYRPGLEQLFSRNTRPRIDAPQRKSAKNGVDENTSFRPRHETHQSEPIATTYWDRLQDKLSFVLSAAPSYWQEASDPQRLKLFCRTLDQLREQCAEEGLVGSSPSPP